MLRSRSSAFRWLKILCATTTAPSYTPVDLAKHSEAETRIRAALKSPAQFEFVNTPLRGVVDYLKDRYHIEVQLDNKALADVGIAPDTPITQSVKDVSLRSALRLMLKEHGLTYVIAEEVLLITTPEDADNKLETKVYPVADLVVPPGATDAEEADFDSLIDLLKQNVRPTSWDDSGGVGSISPFGTNLSLVISQNQEVQDEISDVIDRLRKLNKEQAKLGVPTRKPLSEEERRARQAALAGQGGGTPGGLGGGAGGGRKGMMGGMGGMGGSFGGRGKDMRGGMGGKPEGKNPEPTELDTTTLTRPPATPAPAASAPALDRPPKRVSKRNHDCQSSPRRRQRRRPATKPPLPILTRQNGRN